MTVFTATDVLHNPTVQSKIFDERYLVLSIDAGSNPMTFNGGHPIGDFPLVNQQLLPLMIYETGLTEVQVDPIGGIQPIHYFPGPNSGISGYLRYPGAVFMDPNRTDSTADPSGQRIPGAHSRGLCSESLSSARDAEHRQMGFGA